MNLFLINKEISSACLENKDILFGPPSFCNLSQLSIDCFLSTLSHFNRIQKIGYLESQFLLPMTGYDTLKESGSFELCMPIEVYLSEENIVIIQRSPCLRGSDDKFTDEFLIFARTIKFRSLSILAGVRIPFSIKNPFFLISKSNGPPILLSSSTRIFKIYDHHLIDSISSDKIEPWIDTDAEYFDSLLTGTLKSEAQQSSDHFQGMNIPKLILNKGIPTDNIQIYGMFVDNINPEINAKRLLIEFLKATEWLMDVDLNHLHEPQSWKYFYNTVTQNYIA